MQTIKIFLASSAELKADRDALRMFISVENDRLHKKGIYLELVQWEYFLDAVSDTRLQDDYNKALKDSDVVLSLFFTRAGKFTQEEFETAYKRFKKSGKPMIFTYFKDAPVNMQEVDEQVRSLLDFKKRLNELRHFPTIYKNIDDLKLQFKQQLETIITKMEKRDSGTPPKKVKKKSRKKSRKKKKLGFDIDEVYNFKDVEDRGIDIGDAIFGVDGPGVDSFPESLPDFPDLEPKASSTAGSKSGSTPTSRPEPQRGVILHSIPKKMQLKNIHRCIIRVAVDKEKVLKNLPDSVKDKEILEGVRITEQMEVTFEDSEYKGQKCFDINPINSEKQIVEAFEATEWNFDVTPLQLGSFPLTFRIAVILGNGRKEVAQTVTVTVTTEPVETAMVFVKAILQERNTNENKMTKTDIRELIGKGKPSKATKSILFAAANPTDKARLQTGKELRTITEEMQKGDNRDDFSFLPAQLAVRVTELLRSFHDNPTIIHFSGHGEAEGILVSNNDNEALLLNSATLKLLFKPLRGKTELVLLNSCHSAEQAELISKFGIIVIGHNIPIEDDAAISFAKGFYLGLSEGMSYEAAYTAGATVVVAENMDYAGAIEVWKDGAKLDW